MTNFELWLRYWMIWPGLYRLGYEHEADVVLGLAFGRGQLPDSRLSEISDILDECDGDDILAIHAILKQARPGEPNCLIADEVRCAVTQLDLHALVQWEIALGFSFPWLIENADRVTILWPSRSHGTEFNTRDVLTEAMALHKFARPLIVAHQRMIVPAVLMARRMGLYPVVRPHQVREFNPVSAQPHTTNGLHWLTREAPERIYLKARGWV